MNKLADDLTGPHLEETQRALYLRIMQFEIDDGPVELTFAQRLALENGWSSKDSERVLHEYKRFVFLLATADHPITPSDQVDQAWHLHLTYTRSYWERLCRDVIGRPLHHTPTQGGGAELRKFDGWYFAALTAYRRVFGQAPPSDIWPDPENRFRDILYFQRINTRRHWVIRKPRGARAEVRSKYWLVGVGVLATALGAAFPLFAASSVNNTRGGDSFLGWIAFLLVSALVAGLTVLLFQSRCLACGRFNALKITGGTETRDGAKQWDEYQCKYCESRVWRAGNKGNGGGCSGGGGGGGGDGGGCGGGCGG